MATGRVNVGGGGGALNIFTQMSEPATKEGIWVKTSNKYKKAKSVDSITTVGTWANLNDYPQFTYNLSAHSVNEKDGIIYVLGGTQSSKKIYAYDTSTNTIIPKTDSPYEMRYHTSAIVGDYIYVFSGPGSNYDRAVSKYDIANDTWITAGLTPIPNTSNNSLTSAVVGTKIYLIGNGASSKLVQIYDTVNNTWSTLNNAPYSYKDAASVAYGDKIVVFGGRVGTSPSLSSVYILDTNTNTWTNSGDLPTTIAFHSAVLVGVKAYIIGGMTTSAAMNNKTYEVDLSTAVITELPSMPTPTAYVRGVLSNNKIYAIGGTTNGNEANATKYTQVLNLFSTTFANDTLVLMRSDENTGTYKTELVTPNVKIEGVKTRLLTGFHDAWLYTEGALQEYPTYIGDGEQWVKIKN